MTDTPPPSFVATPPPVMSFPQPVMSFYFNGFALALSSSDVSAVLMVDNQPVCKLNMSFTTAKTLKHNLTELVAKLEEVTQHEIMLAGVVDAGLKKIVEEGAK